MYSVKKLIHGWIFGYELARVGKKGVKDLAKDVLGGSSNFIDLAMTN